MSTEPEVPTGDEPSPAAETPEVTAPDAEHVEEKPETQEVPEAEKALKRMQRRIDKRTADFHHERAQREMLAQKVAELEARLQTPEETPSTSIQIDDRLVDERADIKLFAKTANSIVATGRAENPDFMNAMADLSSEVGEFVRPNGAPSMFMKVVLDVAENPTKLLYHLGKNPDVASEVADLGNPHKLAVRLKEIERELGAPKAKPSAAPKPIDPLKPKSVTTGYYPEMSDAEFDKWRRETKARR